MGVYKKRERFYIDYYLPDGRRKRESVSVPGVDPAKITQRQAEKALSVRRAEIALGKFDIVDTTKRIPFEKLTERFLEYSIANKKSYERDITSIKSLLKHLGGKTIQQINSWHIEQYKSNRQKETTIYGRPPAKATINRELACLKTMFNKAIKWSMTTNNPARDIKLFKEKQNKMRILSNEEFEKLYDSSSEFLRKVLIVAINTGMRRGEILNLRWEDVDFSLEYILVGDSKNDESRIIPMNENLNEMLLDLKKYSTSEYLFSHPDGEPVKSVKRSFQSALRRSGIEHCRLHDLRHTFATRLVMAGVDIVTVQELLGHKSIIMTKRYSHPTPEHKKKAVDLVSFVSKIDNKNTIAILKE